MNLDSYSSSGIVQTPALVLYKIALCLSPRSIILRSPYDDLELDAAATLSCPGKGAGHETRLKQCSTFFEYVPHWLLSTWV